MIIEPVAFGPTIRLVPFSGVQFVEYGMNVDRAGRLSRRFIERAIDRAAWIDGRPTYRLIPAWDGASDEGADATAGDDDREYTVTERGALEFALGKWLPVPMLRITANVEGAEELDMGPTNWARVRIVEAPDRATGPFTHLAVFAFDTDLIERRPNRPYTAPSREDAANEHEFRFAHRFSDIGWFLGATQAGGGPAGFQDWVPAWLKEMLREFKQAQRPDRPLRDSDLPNALEHYARYLVLLEYLQATAAPRVIRLTDTVSSAPAIKPVMVDLILDIGNSRTCGILIESHPNEDRVDLNNSLVLQLRDLSEPEKAYSDPFESHVELAHARFGRDHLSRLSSRSRAFFWPSPVRVGPEAARFREMAQGTEAVSGLSSPKRYLCDVRPVNQEWRFPDRDYGADGTPPLIDRAIRQFVNARGDVIAQLDADKKRYGLQVRSDDRIGAGRLTFSRSSYYSFMVAEIIAHAISMVNNAGVRERRRTKDAPRFLRRVILTLPPAMPVQEQRLLRSRAEGAVKLVWQLLGWSKTTGIGIDPPEVHVAWDEASCVQFVYLYGEITQKLGGSVDAFLRLAGRPRPFAEPGAQPASGAQPEPSLRVASIDVGGGTTDLMITTYYAEGNRAINPVQNVREGFRLAGDDILKGVIERLVIPPIERALREAGHPDPRAFLLERFGGDRANMAEQEKHLRRQFVVRVLEPIALRLLADAEDADVAVSDAAPVRSFGEVFANAAHGPVHSEGRQRLLRFLEGPAQASGAPSFALEQCIFQSDPDVIRSCVVAVLDTVFDNLSEAIHALDCDVVLLSGRPSRLAGVVDLLVGKLGVSPERIIPLHQYQAGAWYPFRDRDNRRIGDPKTTTAVGGMLCALAESQLTNFTMFTNRLGLRSTAKYIGELESDGRLRNDRLCFRNIDLDQKRSASDEVATLKYYAPMRLGYRQLPIERWIATPLYRLRLRPGIDLNAVRLPIEITLERSAETSADDEGPDSLMLSEAIKEDFKIISAVDQNGLELSNRMELVLDTLASEQGYWLDTGILSLD
ncbi:virulence factor SrfB [Alsobacter metallidurans]|uniref:Virulence factor SrfB n=1 Tax=Alsobacter metallidurans TaxID=340221 RepID=A0A917I915_9HYPH|nr:virulence factor SrfB [Alsobacter metallidurans]GGH27776.1 virulence factor SrfB [Alsobacter metallidurans]